ncbi:tripartite ATP-independent transporter DctP family solute receptor [Algoriphagus sp. 4150]|uniref:TRAP transporter substrate-binding protein n=1 Tax=Algoriphagus sp. 4150 TaxID=2817756 RepID=UPI00285FBC28|nr:TRAP transporter substrate-binding protein [Algoriphagus sp. 4150]MDR7131593.1 tripartite ATP-independent transporter DctP family solute receptor [Algoriphagus sp. 4150]
MSLIINLSECTRSKGDSICWSKTLYISNKLLFLAGIVVLLSAGCVQREKESAEDSVKLRFRLGLELNADTKIWEVSNLFKAELEKASLKDSIKQGEIDVEFYDQGAIGSERQLLEAGYFGVVEMVQVNTAVVTAIEPAFGLLNLPYLFRNEAHHQGVLNGEPGKKILKMLTKHNLQGLGFYSAGFRNMFYKYSTDIPCPNSPADLGGLKIRVMESPTMISTINAMGASAAPLPFSELYQGIKTGVVDGAENSAKVFISSRYHEAGINCFTLTEHTTDQHVLIANSDWLESLDSKYKRRIEEVSREIIPAFNSIWEETTLDAISQIERVGVRINEVEDKAGFLKAVEPVYVHFFKSYPAVSYSLYESIKNYEYYDSIR